MSLLGIMQGRLSPPHPDRLQAFPWKSWESEFTHARDLGIDCLEWVFEAEEHERNPIWTDAGVRHIARMVDTSGVCVRSICADYFMPHPFFRVTAEERETSIGVLQRLILQAAALDARVILLPVLEIAEVRTESEEDLLIDALRQCLPVARSSGVRLGLETELPVERYRMLVERVGDASVGAYYDVGNAAAKGFAVGEDVRALGTLLYGIHIKDRELGGGSVPLGEGAADFADCFQALKEMRYDGVLTLQTYFSNDYLSYADRHVRFVRDQVERS